MRYFFYYICLPILFYPVYFLVANLIDSLFGDQQLINWLYFDSWSVLLKTFFKDWLSSLSVMYMIFYLVILPMELLSRKIFNTSMLFMYIASLAIVTVGSYIVGFKQFGLIINASTVFFIITLVCFSQVLLFSQSKK